MGKQTGLGRSSFRVWLAIYWQDDTPWGFRPFRTIWTDTSLEDITPFSSSRWILVCGGQPFIYCTMEIRHSKLSLPARGLLLKVKLLSMLHSRTNGRDIQASQLLDIGQVIASRGILSNFSHLPSIFYFSPKIQFFSMLHSGTNGRDIQASQLLDIGQVYASLGVPSDVSQLPSTAHAKSVLLVTLIHLPLVTPRVKLGFFEFLFFFSA
ncbi:hypothetical protein AVEN_241272-1 [Araneus ventricosus]|uniref:Uncharacterized protein n=1 Tax=Araneus ventricosus TaxID=182803 RepID=A0A4Y2NKT5_ARAVE|nr:hypothetical protein AVEN_241272-1 [Araneus ventricosus]